MAIARRDLLRLSAIATAAPTVARAQQAKPIRVGVLGDMNGPYSDFGGPGATIAARLAAEEFGGGTTSPQVEVLSADHQNKPDIAVSIARNWIDTQGVDAIVECATSGSALALQPLLREKQRILLICVAGSSDITNKACSPFGFHFNCDTYALDLADLAVASGDTLVAPKAANRFAWEKVKVMAMRGAMFSDFPPSPSPSTGLIVNVGSMSVLNSSKAPSCVRAAFDAWRGTRGP